MKFRVSKPFEYYTFLKHPCPEMVSQALNHICKNFDSLPWVTFHKNDKIRNESHEVLAKLIGRGFHDLNLHQILSFNFYSKHVEDASISRYTTMLLNGQALFVNPFSKSEKGFDLFDKAKANAVVKLNDAFIRTINSTDLKVPKIEAVYIDDYRLLKIATQNLTNCFLKSNLTRLIALKVNTGVYDQDLRSDQGFCFHPDFSVAHLMTQRLGELVKNGSYDAFLKSRILFEYSGFPNQFSENDEIMKRISKLIFRNEHGTYFKAGTFYNNGVGDFVNAIEQRCSFIISQFNVLQLNFLIETHQDAPEILQVAKNQRLYSLIENDELNFDHFFEFQLPDYFNPDIAAIARTKIKQQFELIKQSEVLVEAHDFLLNPKYTSTSSVFLKKQIEDLALFYFNENSALHKVDLTELKSIKTRISSREIKDNHINYKMRKAKLLKISEKSMEKAGVPVLNAGFFLISPLVVPLAGAMLLVDKYKGRNGNA